MSKEAFFMVAELNKWFSILESPQTLQIRQGKCMTALLITKGLLISLL